jgi:hypothetical protein
MVCYQQKLGISGRSNFKGRETGTGPASLIAAFYPQATQDENISVIITRTVGWECRKKVTVARDIYG